MTSFPIHLSMNHHLLDSMRSSSKKMSYSFLPINLFFKRKNWLSQNSFNVQHRALFQLCLYGSRIFFLLSFEFIDKKEARTNLWFLFALYRTLNWWQLLDIHDRVCLLFQVSLSSLVCDNNINFFSQFHSNINRNVEFRE